MPLGLDQSRAAPRGARDLRSDLRCHPGARSHRRGRRDPRNRERVDRLGCRAAPGWGLARDGASKKQIRLSLLLEAALSGATATVTSIAAGAGFAYLLVAVINPQSFGWTVVARVPIGKLALTIGIVAAASVLAGIFPGVWRPRWTPPRLWRKNEED
jgi:hypothetical protein